MADPDLQIWEDVHAHLRTNHPASCRQWFQEIEPLGVHGGSLYLRTRSDVHRDYLRRECLAHFNDSVRSVTGSLLAVRFLGPEDDGPAHRVEQRPGARAQPLHAARPAQPGGAHAQVEPRIHAHAYAAPGGGLEMAGPGDGFENDGGRLDDLRPDTDESLPMGRGGIGAPGSPEGGGMGGAGGSGGVGGEGAGYGPRDDGLNYSHGLPPAAPRTQRAFASSEAFNPDHPDALVINPDFGFENFVIGPNNRLAHAAATAVSDNPGRAYNPLFIHGDVGLGKTHLLQAVCLRIRERNPRATMHYLSCDGFITQFMAAVQGGRMNEFRHRFRDVDVLVIDDIHFLARRDRTQEEFFHTFNTLYQSNRQIILSSDAPPEEIPDLEDRLVSRFKWGLVTKVDPPTYETRVEILKSKGKLRGMEIPDEVACHIAARIEANIRELEGAITKIQIHALVAGGGRPLDVSLDLAKEALGETPDRVTKGPSVDAIIQAVTEFYGVKRADVLGKRRHKSISLPRQVCMFLARKHTRHSLEEIGGYFGGRDHTTVMHAIKTVQGKTEGDPEFRSLLAQFERQLLEPGRA